MTRTLTVLAAVFFALPAQAQEIDQSAQSFKNLALMRSSPANIQLPPHARASFFEEEAFDLFGWDKERWDTQGSEIRQWCRTALGDSQVVLDETDRHGVGLQDADAVRSRCSQVYDYSLNVSHRCEQTSNDKGQRFMSCTVDSNLVWRHWNADVGANGIQFSLDGEWQGDGTHLIEDTSSAAVEIKGNVGPDAARKRALNSAAHTSGAFLMRKMLDVPEFRKRAPLVRVDGGSAYTCLGDDQVYQDMPFIVTMATADGMEEVGFTKVRDIYQGCDETPTITNRRNDGEDIVLDPSRNQIILGRSNIQQGMTAEQLPAMGITVGLVAGQTPVAGDETGMRMGIALEYSLARMTGVSELHAVIKAGIHGSDGVIMTDEQILKRMYFGRFFADGAVGISAGFSDFSTQKSPDIYGGILDVGGGIQLSPRLLLRGELGYRMQVGTIEASGVEFGIVTTWLI